MIRLENIYYSYETKEVFKDFNLEIKEGEKVALLGCNGSGKSTLLRIIAGLIFPKKGKFFFKNQIVKKRKIGKDFRKKIGVLFQNPESMIFNPTVKDEIAFSLKEFDFCDIENRIEKIAKEFGLEQLLKKNPLTLSGGEKQKVMLASILAYEPELLLLDEPTASMDPRTTGWFIDFVLNMQKSIVLSTHNLSLAYEICNRAIVLDENHKLIFDGSLDLLFKDIDTLLRANLIYKPRHKHKRFIHSYYHLHFD